MIRLPQTGGGPVRHQPLSEINVTPMVDVMLVLLIIFMVATPLMVAGVKVSLPKSATAAKLAPEKPVVVNVAPDGALSVDGQPVYQTSLVRVVRAALGDVVTRPVYVAGDEAADYGQIIAVIDDLAKGGMARVVLVADRTAAGAADAATPPAMDHASHDHSAHLQGAAAAGQE